MHIILLLLATLFLATPCMAEDDLKLLNSEQIGPLKIGLPANRLKSLIPAKPERSHGSQSEEDGMYHEDWNYSKQGIFLDIIAENKSSPQTIGKITISSPFQFATKRGIHIGSTKGDAEQAYQKDIDRENSRKGEELVAGSPHGGLIFRVKKTKVVEITLGAIAE